MKKILVCLMTLSVIVMVAGCTKWEEKAYKTIKTASTAYDSTMQMAHDYAKDDIDDDTKREEFLDQVEAIAEPVQKTLLAAVNAMRTYSAAATAYDTAVAAADNSTDTTELEATATAAKAAAKTAVAAIDISTFTAAVKAIMALF